jgi:methylase of polypeptide subunit release factors
MNQESIYCACCNRTFRRIHSTEVAQGKPKTILNATEQEIKHHYDHVLNKDRSTYQSSNDEPTPMACIEEMIAKIPTELWSRPDLKILDPCCGNGNFAVPVYYEIRKRTDRTPKSILENTLYFNDINSARLKNARTLFGGCAHQLHMSQEDFLAKAETTKFDLIMANPPYAKLMPDGSRASKNHNLIKDFIEKSLALLKPDGYLLFITPDNWMSFADRNQLIKRLTALQIIHLDIHSAKRHFKKIGSSFTWYIIQNRPATGPMTVSGIWKNKPYTSPVTCSSRSYIPLFYTSTVRSILAKTVDNDALPKFALQTSSDLHHYTKRALLSPTPTPEHTHRLIHTPSQTVYASRAHIYQEGYKVFISVTDKYGVFVDDCGMTQSIGFIRCASQTEANAYKHILEHPLYVFINNICRWGNFNNIRILQRLPIPQSQDPYAAFGITEDEKKYIMEHL